MVSCLKRVAVWQSGRRSKIEERGTHSTDRMVVRKTSETRLNHGKVRHGPEETKNMNFTSMGRTNHEVRHGYTNCDGLENKRSLLAERSTKETQSEVVGVHPRRFSYWRREVQIPEFKEYKDGWSADVKKKHGMARSNTGQNRMDMKKRSFFRGEGKCTPKHKAHHTTNNKSVPSKKEPLKVNA